MEKHQATAEEAETAEETAQIKKVKRAYQLLLSAHFLLIFPFQKL